jgi:hypothetical protein
MMVNDGFHDVNVCKTRISYIINDGFRDDGFHDDGLI